MRAQISAFFFTGVLFLSSQLQANTASFDQAFTVALEFAGSYAGACKNYAPMFSLDIQVTKYDDPSDPVIEIAISKNMRPSAIYPVAKMGENLSTLISPKSPWGFYQTYLQTHLHEGHLQIESMRETFIGVKPFVWLEETLMTEDEFSLDGDLLSYVGTASDSQMVLDCILERLP